MHISMPISRSNIRIRAAARWAETWRTPIIARFFRDNFGGTKEYAEISNTKAPTNDTQEFCRIYINPFHTVPRKLLNWLENVSSWRMWFSSHYKLRKRRQLGISDKGNPAYLYLLWPKRKPLAKLASRTYN